MKKKKINKKDILSDFVFKFVLVFFLLFTLIMVGAKLLGFQVLTIDSGSMEPNLPKDSLILIKKVDPFTLQTDDVITFIIDTEGTLETQRIVGIRSEDRSFITKGDANDVYDAPVPLKNIVGKVELCLPNVGGAFRAVTAEKNRIYVFIAIGIFIFLTVLWSITDIIKNKKTDES